MNCPKPPGETLQAGGHKKKTVDGWQGLCSQTGQALRAPTLFIHSFIHSVTHSTYIPECLCSNAPSLGIPFWTINTAASPACNPRTPPHVISLYSMYHHGSLSMSICFFSTWPFHKKYKLKRKHLADFVRCCIPRVWNRRTQCMAHITQLSAVSTQVPSFLCSLHVFKREVAAATWSKAPFPHLPPSSLKPGVSVLGKGQLSHQDMGIQRVLPAKDPKVLPGTSTQIRGAPRRGRSALALPLQAEDPAMIHISGGWRAASPDPPPSPQTGTTALTSVGLSVPVSKMGQSG